MVAFFVFEGQESWLLAILVIVIALMAHVAFRPFEAALTDVAEMFSLVANLVLLVSVPVYAVLQDSADTERAVRVVWFLEGTAVSLILAVCIVAGHAQLLNAVAGQHFTADDLPGQMAGDLFGKAFPGFKGHVGLRPLTNGRRWKSLCPTIKQSGRTTKPAPNAKNPPRA